MICNAIKNIEQLDYSQLSGLGEYICNLVEYDILCLYEQYGFQLKKLFLLLEKEGIYLSKEIFELVINDRLINKHETPIAHARNKLKKLTKWNRRTKDIAINSKLDWERLSKQFIHSNTTNRVKKEIWEISLPKRSLEGL